MTNELELDRPTGCLRILQRKHNHVENNIDGAGFAAELIAQGVFDEKMRPRP